MTRQDNVFWLLVVVWLCWLNNSNGQTLLRVTDWQSYALDLPQRLLNDVTKQALQALSERRNVIASLSSADQWKQRQNFVKQALQSALGPLPSVRTPLNVNITSSFEWTEGGFRVEMLHFESRPSFIVSAALYLPLKRTNPAPAVIFTSGHTPQAFRADETSGDSYQIVINNLAKKGFVVLAYDPPSQGERCMYCDRSTKKSVVGGCTFSITTGKGHGDCTAEHNYYGRQLFLNNVTAASVWLWDGIRALDYLMTRSEVDKTRIGVAGCSGGGTQASYLAATDNRLQIASIACYMSTFDVDFRFQGAADAEQQWNRGVINGLDKADLVEIRAPKPTQVLLTTDDGDFPVQGGRLASAEAAAAYRALNASNNFESHEALWHHGYVQPNREALYSFFLKHFNVSGIAKEDPIPPIPVSKLLVTKLGQVVWDLNSRTVHDLVVDYTTENVARLNNLRYNQTKQFLASLPQRASQVSGYQRPTIPNDFDKQPLSLGSVLGGEDFGNDTLIEKWLLSTQETCVISLLVYRPISAQSCDVILFLTNDSTINDQPTSLTKQLVKRSKEKGACLIQINTCGHGEVGNAFQREPHPNIGSDGNVASVAGFVGKSIVAIHAANVYLVINYVLSRNPQLNKIVGLVAANHSSSVALHFAVLEQQIMPKLVLIQDVVSYESIALSQYYSTPSFIEMWGVLASYDLPDVAAALAPRPLLVLGPTDATLMPLSQMQAQQAYNFTSYVYSLMKASSSLKIDTSSSGADQIATATINWLLSSN